MSTAIAAYDLGLFVSSAGGRAPIPTHRARGVVFRTNEHGDESLTCEIPLHPSHAWKVYNRYRSTWVMLACGLRKAFSGRLADVRLIPDGIAITALGGGRALTDIPYTGLFSTTDVSGWRAILTSEISNRFPDRYAFDTNNRIAIAPAKGSVQGTPPTIVGSIGFIIPDQSTQQIVGVEFDAELTVAVNYQVGLQTWASASWGGAATTVWTLNGGAAPQTIVQNFTCAAANRLAFYLFSTVAPAVYAGETGDVRLVIANLRLVTDTTRRVNTTTTVANVAGAGVTMTVGSTAGMYAGQQLKVDTGAGYGRTLTVTAVTGSTTFTTTTADLWPIGTSVKAWLVYADTVVTALTGALAAVNPDHVSSTPAMISSPGLDLIHEDYADRSPLDICTYLAGLGDDQTPPAQWEFGTDDTRVYFRQRGSAGRIWYADADDMTIESSEETLANSAYTVFQDASGRTLRTATSDDTPSAERYGLTRRSAISARTTSSTQATAQRDAALADKKDIAPRASVTIRRITTFGGTTVPKDLVRSGDTLIVRNLPQSALRDVDRIARFRLLQTAYAIDDDTLTVTPETPLPHLESMLARLAAGITT